MNIKDIEDRIFMGRFSNTLYMNDYYFSFGLSELNFGKPSNPCYINLVII